MVISVTYCLREKLMVQFDNDMEPFLSLLGDKNSLLYKTLSSTLLNTNLFRYQSSFHGKIFDLKTNTMLNST